MMKYWPWMCLLIPSLSFAAATIPFTPKQMQGLGIMVSPVSATQQVNSHHLPGTIMVPVNQERVISSPQAGLLISVAVTAGQTVKRGQALAQINSNALIDLQRDFLQTQTQLRLAKNMLERDESLFKDGIIAERRLLSTRSNHEELVTILAQRKQALKLAGMGDAAIQKLENGHQNISPTLTISAPIDGTVLEQMATAGQQVDSNTPIYRIARLHPLWLEIAAPVDALNYAKEGMRLSIPKFQAEGKIINIIRHVNKTDQTIRLRAEINQGTERLLPGQYVEAVLVTAPSKNEFSVPQSAVIRNNQKSYVFVETSGGFKPVPVRVISEQGSQVVIAAELSGKEKVAINGTVAIKAVWSGMGGE